MSKFTLWPFFKRKPPILTKEQNDEWVSQIAEMEQERVQSEIDYVEAVERLKRANLALKKGETLERLREWCEAAGARESLRGYRSIHDMTQAMKEEYARRLEKHGSIMKNKP